RSHFHPNLPSKLRQRLAARVHPAVFRESSGGRVRRDERNAAAPRTRSIHRGSTGKSDLAANRRACVQLDRRVAVTWLSNASCPIGKRDPPNQYQFPAPAKP